MATLRSLMALRTAALFCLAWWVALFLGLASPASAETPEPPPARKPVTLHENLVFELHRGEGSLSLSDRAQRASRAMDSAASTAAEPEVRVPPPGDIAGVLAGETPIVQLREEDAQLSGEASLDVHAATVASRIRTALKNERRRASVANTVFSFSLVVFFGLVTVYLVGRLSEFVARARTFVLDNPQSIPALRLKSLDVIGAASVRNGSLVFLGIARWASLFGLAYAWLVLSLSLFESTRPYTEKLTGIVLAPLTALVGRVASALPLFAVVLAAVALVAVLLRISDLFFQSVDRGETRVSWLAPELALAASLVVRLGIVLFALIFVGPVITGDGDGALSRTGMVLLVAFSAAAIPSLASVIAGVSTVFSRTLSLGDHVEYGGERGRVREIGILS